MLRTASNPPIFATLVGAWPCMILFTFRDCNKEIIDTMNNRWWYVNWITEWHHSIANVDSFRFKFKKWCCKTRNSTIWKDWKFSAEYLPNFQEYSLAFSVFIRQYLITKSTFHHKFLWNNKKRKIKFSCMKIYIIPKRNQFSSFLHQIMHFVRIFFNQRNLFALCSRNERRPCWKRLPSHKRILREPWSFLGLVDQKSKSWHLR